MDGGGKVMFQVIYLEEIIQLLLKTISASGLLITKLFILCNATEKCLFEERK